MNQVITFLSDGDDKLRALQMEMSPKATHILDWFHLVRQEVARVIVGHGTGRDPTWCPITSTLAACRRENETPCLGLVSFLKQAITP